jgi:PIN domain nuclease of toxin-antitoxin system
VAALSRVSLPVYLGHALQVGLLPHFHRDPFDRLLIAQSHVERVPLMTADAVIAQYDIEVIWAGRGRAPRRS